MESEFFFRGSCDSWSRKWIASHAGGFWTNKQVGNWLWMVRMWVWKDTDWRGPAGMRSINIQEAICFDHQAIHSESILRFNQSMYRLFVVRVCVSSLISFIGHVRWSTNITYDIYVSENNGTPKIHFNRVPLFWKHPYILYLNTGGRVQGSFH